MSHLKNNELTTKQKKFVEEYVKDGNGKQAAIRAGYSKKTAKQIASENLSKPYLKDKVDEKMSKHAEEMGITAKYVLGRLKYWADKDNQELSSASIKSTELLGKHLHMFGDKVEVSIKSHEESLKELE